MEPIRMETTIALTPLSDASAPNTDTSARPEYRELFCLITFTDDGAFYIVPYHEIAHPAMAELAIPYQRGDVLYGITCYVTNFANSHPIPHVALLLKDCGELLCSTILEAQAAKATT